jgi:hypothetical protein
MKKLILFTAAALFTMAVFAQTNATSNKTQVDKELLTGIWKTGHTIYAFDKSGASTITIKNRNCPGTWKIDGQKIIVSPKKLAWKKDDPCSQTTVLAVKNLSENGLEIIETAGNREIHLAKQK